MYEYILSINVNSSTTELAPPSLSSYVYSRLPRSFDLTATMRPLRIQFGGERNVTNNELVNIQQQQIILEYLFGRTSRKNGKRTDIVWSRSKYEYSVFRYLVYT